MSFLAVVASLSLAALGDVFFDLPSFLAFLKSICSDFCCLSASFWLLTSSEVASVMNNGRVVGMAYRVSV